MTQNTYGDFIDLIEKTKITEAAVFIERWKKLAAEEQWIDTFLTPSEDITGKGG